MLVKYVLDEIVENDLIRLMSRDGGRGHKNSLLFLGLGAVFVFLMTLVISYSLGPSLALETIGPPLLLGSLMFSVFLAIKWLKATFSDELPSEIVINSDGLVIYGAKRKVVKRLSVSLQERLTIAIEEDRIEIFYGERVRSVVWYRLSDKSSTPQDHVAHIFRLFGRLLPTGVEGSRGTVYRSLGIEMPAEVVEEDLVINPNKIENPKFRIDKNGQKFIVVPQEHHTLFTVTRRKNAMHVKVPLNNLSGLPSSFKVRPGEISYKEHMFFTVRVRPEEVEGVIYEPGARSGQGGRERFLVGVTILLKAKTGSTYELINSTIDSEDATLLAQDFYEAAQRLCEEVNVLFNSLLKD